MHGVIQRCLKKPFVCPVEDGAMRHCLQAQASACTEFISTFSNFSVALLAVAGDLELWPQQNVIESKVFLAFLHSKDHCVPAFAEGNSHFGRGDYRTSKAPAPGSPLP